jgi:hypothetical protein
MIFEAAKLENSHPGAATNSALSGQPSHKVEVNLSVRRVLG